MTKEEDITKQTYDKLARKWADSHSTESFWALQMKDFHRFLPSGKILEVGCGSGRDAKELLQFGYEYVGTDFSEALLERARESNPGTQFLEMNLYDLDFSEKFDGFWCAAVLLHIPKKRIDEALSSIKKSIRKGAIGFVSVKEGEGEGIESRGGEKGYDRLITYWDAEDFERTFRKNGFEVLKQGKRPHKDSMWLTYIVRSA